MLRSRRNPCTLSAVRGGVPVRFARPAEAQVITLYSSNFNAPTYSDGVLNVGTDTTTPGQDSGSNSGGGQLTTSPFRIRRRMACVAHEPQRAAFAVCLTGAGQTVTSGSVWFQADVTVSAAQSRLAFCLAPVRRRYK